MEKVFLRDGIESITYCMFSGCSKLKDIYISSSIREICAFSFLQCISIENIFFDGSVSEWKNIDLDTAAFTEGTELTVHCNDGLIEYVIND